MLNNADKLLEVKLIFLENYLKLLFMLPYCIIVIKICLIYTPTRHVKLMYNTVPSKIDVNKCKLNDWAFNYEMNISCRSELCHGFSDSISHLLLQRYHVNGL